MKLAPRNKYSLLDEQHVMNCVTDSLKLTYGRKLHSDTERSLGADSSGGLCENGDDVRIPQKTGSFSRSTLRYIKDLSWKT
jgi:hypothetical protein